MIAEILATGDEIRSGALIDSNSAYIAEKLQEAGIPVTRHNCVGDDLDVLISILKEISTNKVMLEVPDEIWTEEYLVSANSTVTSDNEEEALDVILEDLSQKIYRKTVSGIARL